MDEIEARRLLGSAEQAIRLCLRTLRDVQPQIKGVLCIQDVAWAIDEADRVSEIIAENVKEDADDCTR